MADGWTRSLSQVIYKRYSLQLTNSFTDLTASILFLHLLRNNREYELMSLHSAAVECFLHCSARRTRWTRAVTLAVFPFLDPPLVHLTLQNGTRLAGHSYSEPFACNCLSAGARCLFRGNASSYKTQCIVALQSSSKTQHDLPGEHEGPVAYIMALLLLQIVQTL